MREKTRKIFIMIVMAALIVSLMAASFAALTYGRYSGGRRDENSAYEDILDLVGETAFEVSTADELVNAINNGYSYIKVVGDDPTLVVNNNVADVVVNLVLDVNGHKIVRNSRNPLLNVRQSVSVVLVYDSSEKAEGGFYNPVGSALQTSGGTLTVGEGVYESGPRTGIGLDFSHTVSATVCSRDGRKAASYSAQKTDQTFPKLTEDTGDVYLDENYSGTGDYLKPDTYLIYTEEENAFVRQGEETVGGTVLQNEQLYVNRKETSSGGTTTITADKFSPICDVASCDFYYYYPVGTAGTANSPQTYAVVYGYNEVKGLAKAEKKNLTSGNDTNLVWPYAAIRSEAGNTHARGGEFYTYFGEENTYSIYSEGGTMTVGLSGESDPPTFQAIGKGVCINMAGTSGSADQTLTIDNGKFSSQLGNTIEMSGGEMEVKKGSFTKDATGADENSTNNGSAISISGGTLTSSDTEDTSKPIQFHISGSYVNGIYAKGGEVNIANATFAFENGKNNQGVYNDGGTSRAHWCDFTIPGNNNYGIHSTNGTTRASDCAIKMTGEYAVGVYTTGGRALIEGGSIKVNFAEDKEDKNNKLLTSTAVSTEGGEIYLAGSLKIESDSLGVTVRQGEDTSGLLEIATDTITTTDGTTYSDIDSGNVTINTPNATGIYVNNGNLTNKGTVTVTSSVGNEEGADKGWNWVNAEGNPLISFNKYNGVFVNGGSLVSNGTLNVEFTGVQNEESGTYLDQQIKSYAVRVETAASGGKTEVSIAGGEISNSVGGGVYVGGGTVTLGKQETTNGVTTYSGPTVQTTGTVSYSTSMDPDGGNWNYFLPQTGGPAVKVAQSGSVSSTLTVYGGTYTAQQGDGIVTVGGTSYIHNGTFIGKDFGVTSGGRAGPGASYSFKVYGGTANVYGGTFGGRENGSYINSSGAFVMGTSANSMGTANIYGGTFVVSSGNTGGQAGFSVYEYGNVVVDPGKGGEQQNLGGDVTMTGLAAGLVIEGNTSNPASVQISGGTFSSTRDNGHSDGIWYSNSNATLTISDDDTALTGFDRSGLWLEAAPAIENGVTITGGTITGKQDGIHYGSNGTAANGLLISGGTITGTNGSGLNLAGAPAASGAVTISGGTITGSNHGVYYGASGAVNDGLLIEGGTITGSNGSGLYFAVNPWQNGGTNNVAIVGGTFKGVPEKKGSDQNPFYINGAISAPSEGWTNIDYDGLGRQIRLGDILKTHTGDGKVAYVVEGNDDWNGNSNLGDNYDYSIAVTVSSMESVSIKLYNQ